MALPTYRILASIIPLQAALMLVFAWSASRPPAVKPLVEQADHLVVSKAQHRLTVYAHGKVLKTYSVAIGRASGAKEFAGDHKTPEGRYIVDGRNPHSRFRLALHLSYPNAGDRTRAAAAGRSAGGGVEIHGLIPGLSFLGSLQRTLDWTDGCVALTNAEIDELYPTVPVGTPVDLLP